MKRRQGRSIHGNLSKPDPSGTNISGLIRKVEIVIFFVDRTKYDIRYRQDIGLDMLHCISVCVSVNGRHNISLLPMKCML